eukprot:c21696_g2_i1 orf=430-618(+)
MSWSAEAGSFLKALNKLQVPLLFLLDLQRGIDSKAFIFPKDLTLLSHYHQAFVTLPLFFLVN